MRAAPVCLAFGALFACARPAPRDTSAPPPPPPPPQMMPAEPAPPPLTIVEPTTPPELPPAAPVAPPETLAASGCAAPSGRAATRSAGGLVVPAVPGKRRLELAGRLRSHVDGALSARAQRTWVGPPVPSFVPLSSGTLELFLLDPTPNGYFALYRDPYDAGSCKLSGSVNCESEVAGFDCAGKLLFRVPLAPYGFTAEPDFLFVVRRSDGKIMQRESIPSAHEDLIDGPGSVVAQMEPGRGLLFTREGFDGPSPRLVLQGMSEQVKP